MKRSDKNLDDTKSTRNKDYDANEALKTIREIRNENCDEEKIVRDLYFTFDPRKDVIMNLKKLLMLLIILKLNMKEWEINTNH